MSSITQHSLKITKETLKKVTVFNDRAELLREFTVQVAPGTNEVAVEAISQHVNDESVRVTGRGAAIIEEVQVAQRRIVRGAADSEKAAGIRKEKEDLETSRKKVDFEGQSIQKRIGALDGMIGQIGEGIGAPKGEKFAADEGTLTSITTFFGFYEQQVAKLREDYHANRKEFDRLSGLISVKEHELAQIEQGDYSKDIVIVLEAFHAAAGPATVVLEVVYQVWLASWTPFYDVRVETKDGKTEMQLSYYANVNQNTGEEWEGAQLVLSSARPCLGGNIPDLGTLDVSFYRPPPVRAGGYGGYGAARAAPMGMMRKMKRSIMSDESSNYDMNNMAHSYAAVNEQTLSTEFAIARPCSIPADGAQHKVTIGIVTLAPQLVHESVPTKNSSAFLTASAINSSQLPLLPGQASVYLDGAFVAKTVLKAVSPGERFTASLGVDPAVKIEYKPAHKHHEQTGLINKWSSTVTEQKIVVRNTRGDAVLLTIREQIPRSTDEKIKVKMISPESVEKVTEDHHLNGDQTPKAGARLLPSNNLEWTVKLEKGTSQVLLVKYAVDHPSNEKLEFAERL